MEKQSLQVLSEQYSEVSDCMMALLSDVLLLDLLDRSPRVSVFPDDVCEYSKSCLIDYLEQHSSDLFVELSHFWDLVRKYQ